MTIPQTHRLIEARTIAEQVAPVAHHVGTGQLLWGLLTAAGLANQALWILRVDHVRVRQELHEEVAAPRRVRNAELTPQGRRSFSEAAALAKRQGSTYVGTEHLLSALAQAPECDSSRHLAGLFRVDGLAIERELAGLHGCSLAWRAEFDPDSAGEFCWRPIPSDCRAWRGGTCVQIAASIRDDQAFDRLPILGDALEEAGCLDEEVLRHCHEHAGQHVRWCWLIEALAPELRVMFH